MTAIVGHNERQTGRQLTSNRKALQQVLDGRVGQVLSSGRLPFLVSVYLAAVVLPVIFSLGPITMTGVRALLILLIVPMTIRLFSGAYGRVILPDVLFFLHVLWFTAALAINNPEQVIANAGSTGIEFIGGYVLGRACIRDRKSFVALIRAMGFVCVCILLFVLYETLTGTSPILRIINGIPGIRSLPDIDIGKRLGLSRVQSSFAHPIHSGLFFTLTFSLCFVGLQEVYGEFRRWFVAAACAICAFLALSSGALLALFLQFGLIAWAMLFRRVRQRWWFLLGLFVVLYLLVSLLSNRTPIRVFLSYATFSAHTAYWRTIIFDYGMQNVWSNPWFGLGLNDWVRPRWMHSGSVDNFWLLTTMRYGIPGFLFLAGGYLWALWRIGTRDFGADPALWRLRRAWMFSFVGLTFTLCTVHVWHTIFSYVFFMFGAGMWMLGAASESDSSRDRNGGIERTARFGRDTGSYPSRDITRNVQGEGSSPFSTMSGAMAGRLDTRSTRNQYLSGCEMPYTRFTRYADSE